MRSVARVASLTLALVLGPGLNLGCDQASPAKPAAAADTSQRSTSDKVVAPGMVEPFGGEVDLSAEEAGRVAKVLVQEGQGVTEGQVLAELESGAQRAALLAAQAQLEEARASLLRVKRGPTREEVEQARAERDGASARARLSGDEASRSDRLKEKGAISQAEWERSQRQAESDRGAADAAMARWKNLQKGSRSEDIAGASARVEAATAQLAQAQAALDRRLIKSPVSAAVLWSRYQPGEYYAPGGQALFVLGDITRYQVRADVDEIDVSRVVVGDKVLVRTDAGGEPVAEGKVIWVSPRMGRKNVTTETPTSRGDLRIREILVEVPAREPLLTGLRVWTEVPGKG